MTSGIQGANNTREQRNCAAFMLRMGRESTAICLALPDYPHRQPLISAQGLSNR